MTSDLVLNEFICQVFVNKTLEEGREVVYDLYDDVKEEVVEPLSPRVTNMMASATRVMGQVNAISDKVDKISKWIVLCMTIL